MLSLCCGGAMGAARLLDGGGSFMPQDFRCRAGCGSVQTPRSRLESRRRGLGAAPACPRMPGVGGGRDGAPGPGQGWAGLRGCGQTAENARPRVWELGSGEAGLRVGPGT